MDSNPNQSSRQSSGETEIPAALDTARTAQRLFRTFGSRQEGEPTAGARAGGTGRTVVGGARPLPPSATNGENFEPSYGEG
jgi:hypothetical protein